MLDSPLFVSRIARLASLAFLLCGSACSPEGDRPPSILFVVIDTLRADAVSAYGVAEGTTPVLDRLAGEGVRYGHAYAPSSWTVPSHASFFTGQRADQHDVGLRGSQIVPGQFQMLAESLAEAGYQTAGFSENGLVSELFGFDQGFETFAAPSTEDELAASKAGIETGAEAFDILNRIEAWTAQRDPNKPYFLFVNILDPHYPYQVREENRYLPSGLTDDEIRFASTQINIATSICSQLPSERELEILHGLYLGDVAAADSKLGGILQVLEESEGSDRRITVVTSDHGEHFGEHRLINHRFTLYNEALQIPLVISGLHETKGGLVTQAVGGRRIYHSLLCAAGAGNCDEALPGPHNQKSVTEAPTVVSVLSDEAIGVLPAVAEKMGNKDGLIDDSRFRCLETDRVFGRMVSLLKYPFKLTWVLDQPEELYDLSWDRGEKSNMISQKNPQTVALREEMQHFIKTSRFDEGYPSDPDHTMTPKVVEALRSLGYIE